MVSVSLCNHAGIFQTMGAPRNKVHLWSIPTQKHQRIDSNISPADLHNFAQMAAFSVTGLCFHFRQEQIFGGYSLWLSHPPPVLIPAHAMKQNTTDMSGRKALSGRQKHLPKYLHLLLLFIHHQCGDLLLVFGDHLFSCSPLALELVRENRDMLVTFSACNLRPRRATKARINPQLI